MKLKNLIYMIIIVMLIVLVFGYMVINTNVSKKIIVHSNESAKIVPNVSENLNNQTTNELNITTSSEGELITVKKSGGSNSLIAECGNNSYIAEKADYIVEGIVQKSEARWNNDQNNSITTFVDFTINSYLKGTSMGNLLQLQISGGCIEGLCQVIEDQPKLSQGNHLRLYFYKTGTEFSIVCGQFGVEQI